MATPTAFCAPGGGIAPSETEQMSTHPEPVKQASRLPEVLKITRPVAGFVICPGVVRGSSKPRVELCMSRIEPPAGMIPGSLEMTIPPAGVYDPVVPDTGDDVRVVQTTPLNNSIRPLVVL